MSGAIIRRALGVAFMSLLFLVAIDMTTIIVFLVGFGIFLSASAGLVRELRGSRTVPALVLCALSVVMFPVSCANQLRAMAAATRRVEELAARAQSMCDRDGVCPDERALCGGDGCGDAGSLGVRFNIHYAPGREPKQFHVGARLSIDESVSVSGGVGLPLKKEHWLDGSDINAEDHNTGPHP